MAKKNLYSDLKNFHVSLNIAPRWDGSTNINQYSYIENNPEVKNGVEEIAVPYRRGVIESYVETNEIVRDNIEGKLKFYDVGQPIISRALDVYEDVKDSKKGFKFKRKDVLEYAECFGSVKELEGILEIENYFREEKVPGGRVKRVLKKIFPAEDNTRALLGVGGLWVSSLALGYMWKKLSGGNLSGPAISCWLGGVMPLMTFAAFIYPMLLSTPESVIKEPAEKLEEDLKWLDDTFDRIYRGSEGR